MKEGDIRKCDSRDAETLSGLISEAFADQAERFGLDCRNALRHPSNCRPDWIFRDMNRGVLYYLFEHNSTPEGVVALEQINGEVCALLHLAVSPEFRRQGIGARLVRHGLTEARLLGAKRVHAGMMDEDLELRAWFEKLGFVEKDFREYPQSYLRDVILACEFQTC